MKLDRWYILSGVFNNLAVLVDIAASCGDDVPFISSKSSALLMVSSVNLEIGLMDNTGWSSFNF